MGVHINLGLLLWDIRTNLNWFNAGSVSQCLANKHEIVSQCWLNVELPSAKLNINLTFVHCLVFVGLCLSGSLLCISGSM